MFGGLIMADNPGSDPSDDESDIFSDDDSQLDHEGFDPSEVYIYRGKGSIPRNVRRVVRRVEVDRSVKFIPDQLFDSCDQLESMLLHEGLLRIGKWACRCCSSLRVIQIPSTVTEIGWGAFWACSNLAAVELPDGLDLIEDYAFCHCMSLEAVRIPASIARIGDGAFSGCINLASLELSEGLRTIGFGTFDGCQSLESLHVPSSVDEIGEVAFDNCSSLASVQLHEDLSRIKEHAFRRCLLESFRFVPLSDRVEAIRMDDATKSMFDSRLRQITLALTGEDRDDEDINEDDSDDDGGAEAVREKCKECLVRIHEFLTYLELKGASPVLELALWKTKIEGEGEEREQGGIVSEEVRGQNQEETARKRKRLKANKDTDRDPQLSRNDCRVKCGAGIVSSEVLRFFAYRMTWPRLDD